MTTFNPASAKKIILYVIGGIVVFIGAIILIAFLTTGKERDLASQFVNDISSGNTTAAYDQFSDALKNVQDKATFEAQVATLQLDDSCTLEISGMESSTSTDAGTQKKVTGKVVCDSKTLSTANFTYDGDSKLYGYQLQP